MRELLILTILFSSPLAQAKSPEEVLHTGSGHDHKHDHIAIDETEFDPNNYNWVVPKLNEKLKNSDVQLRFANCDLNEINFLIGTNKEARIKGKELIKEIEKRVKDKSLSKKNRKKVKKAAKVAKCALRKLNRPKYVCSSLEKPGIVAMTLPYIGQTINLYPAFWTSGHRYKVSTLFHEATHKCGTSDENYNFQQGKTPADGDFFGWHKVASTYDYWLMKGFCVPDVDC